MGIVHFNDHKIQLTVNYYHISSSFHFSIWYGTGQTDFSMRRGHQCHVFHLHASVSNTSDHMSYLNMFKVLNI